MKVTILVMGALFWAIGSAVAAGSTLVCEGGRDGGAKQEIIFAGPEGFDFQWPGRAYYLEKRTILLRINGAAEATEFNVERLPTALGKMWLYTYSDPRFASFIRIAVDSPFGSPPTIRGSWEVDYPPRLDFSCQITR